jgi:malate dehydrogenase (oxaloacetate-decarboxylating)(NADP+)
MRNDVADKGKLKAAALEYHRKDRPGKVAIAVTKPCVDQRDLSLAYTPGVAEPCREIVKDDKAAYEYTAKGNLVAVVTNGTAVLGLGDIGPLAGKPVMEGKCILFKKFADVDAFDIEVDEKDPDKFIDIVKSLGPSFGGINLEDIKSPDCFYIEERLIAAMDIPVFHDDQHGTAVIVGAAFVNALEIAGKDAKAVKVVFSGAGAAAMACARMLATLGVPVENIWMCDIDGLLTEGNSRGEPNRMRFAKRSRPRSLSDVMGGADVFIGLSAAGVVSKAMISSMNERPVVLAMANPDPEITPEAVKAARGDAIVATGRSDYPNQVNNVLGFPSIFRGALDVRATRINEEMKRAAAMALAGLAREAVPKSVCKAYGVTRFAFGPDYIIPKPLDPRVLLWEAPAVAKAAMESGVARMPIADLAAYKKSLTKRLK